MLAFQENRFKPQAPCRLELGPHDLVVLAVGVTPELHNQVAQIQDLLSWGLGQRHEFRSHAQLFSRF